MYYSAALSLLLPVAAKAAGSAFSYDPNSNNGPADWASLDLGGTPNACGGSAQSGIDIPRTRCDETNADYTFAAGTCTLDDIRFELTDHAIYGHYDASSSCSKPRMSIAGEPVPFEALQFHIHTGTDHAIDGTYFGADMHLVHKEVGGNRLAVLGFFLEPTSPDDTPKFQDLLVEWETVSANTLSACNLDNSTASTTQGAGGRKLTGHQNLRQRQLPRSFNPYNLVPEQSSIYTYQGGLTTPPCTEIVYWNVIDKAVSLSIREFLRLTNLILDYVEPTECEVGASVAAPSGFTGRPVQNRNGRPIVHKCPTGFIDPITAILQGQ